MALGLVLVAMLLAGPASADDYVGTPPPNAGSSDSGGAAGSGAVSAESGQIAQVAHDSENKSGGLAVTGIALILVVLAALLVGTGYLVKRRADRPVT